ncbi:hypothetical protein Tco_1191173 [Tanacetum coccineum]
MHSRFIDDVNDPKTRGVIDKKKVIITESTIRRDLQLEDAEGTECLPTATIFEELTRMGMVKNVDSMVKFWMYPRFVQVFVNQQLGDMSHYKKIYVTPSHTKKIFANIKREGKGFSGTITPLFQTMMVQAQVEMGKELMADETENMKSVPTHSNDPLLSGKDNLKLNELMELCTNLQKKVLDLETTKTIQALKIDSLKRRVNKLEKKQRSRTHKLRRLYKGRKILDIDANEDTTLDSTHVDTDLDMFGVHDLHGDEVFVEIKEPVVKGQGSKDKGKEKMIEPEKPLKKKDQVLFDEQEAIRLQSQFDEEARDKVETNYELAQRLQQVEQEELTIEEKSKLFQQLLEKRRKFFIAKRVEEKRNRPPTKTQQRSIISKRAGDELEQEKAMKQKIDDQEETKLKELMEVIFDEEGVAIDAIPLSTKPPSIVDYKIIKEECSRFSNYRA